MSACATSVRHDGSDLQYCVQCPAVKIHLRPTRVPPHSCNQSMKEFDN